MSLVVAVLAVTGAGMHPLVSPVCTRLSRSETALPIGAVPPDAGSGVVLAVLGGLRALAADLVWLRMFAEWERRNLPATETLLRLAPALDPRPLYFWLNGARIIAHDFPAWRMAVAGDQPAVSSAGAKRIDHEQAASALAFLGAAMIFHPTSSELWIERAGIELNRLGNPAAAAESFRRASELPGAPWFAARLHAQLLRRTGRKTEALAWLIRIHPTLPRDDEAAAAGVVLARIRELEGELGIATEKSYQAAP